jgi:hypothetical protein
LPTCPAQVAIGCSSTSATWAWSAPPRSP